jgi:hypothetical protein
VFELVLEEAMKDRIEKIERELVMLSYHEKSECSINVRGSLNVYYIACTEVTLQGKNQLQNTTLPGRGKCLI